MEHIERRRIAYKGQVREVLSQSNNQYQIKFGRKTITVKVDPYNGAVTPK